MTTYKFEAKKTSYHPGTDGREYFPYSPSADLAKAVQLAIDLQRPLLLEGDPGCGKTQLAYALARQLAEQYENTEWPFFIWNIKSSSRAQDGLYTFDTLARLRDTQLAAIRNPPKTTIIEEENLAQYVKYGALGEAIKATQEKNLRAVLLIDEVDKGNNDFCNDLLDVLEQFSFRVPEVPAPESKSNNELKDKVLEFRSPLETKPIVILTSNQDKPLPNAFLRRCLYYRIPFPEATELKELAEWRLKDKEFSEVKEIFDDAVKLFYEVRHAMSGRMNREPSTSEFIDFLKALQALRKNSEERESVLTKLESHTYLGILLKNEEDQKCYREYKKKPSQS